MKVAITGARGGFGPFVVQAALDAGYDVVSIDKNDAIGMSENAPVVQLTANVSDYENTLSAFQNCEKVIHLAAIPAAWIEADHITHNQNVTGSYNAFRAAAELGIQSICNASSVNAIGFSYGRNPTYDYFPIDENHPTRNEDPYALSKWICEIQADSFARRFENMRIVSVRMHWIVEQVSRARAAWADLPPEKHLWAWTPAQAAAQACVASLSLGGSGHDVVNLVAPETTETRSSCDLAKMHFPETEIRGAFPGNASFFDSSKAQKLLKWHDLCRAQMREG